MKAIIMQSFGTAFAPYHKHSETDGTDRKYSNDGTCGAPAAKERIRRYYLAPLLSGRGDTELFQGWRKFGVKMEYLQPTEDYGQPGGAVCRQLY